MSKKFKLFLWDWLSLTPCCRFWVRFLFEAQKNWQEISVIIHPEWNLLSILVLMRSRRDLDVAVIRVGCLIMFWKLVARSMTNICCLPGLLVTILILVTHYTGKEISSAQCRRHTFRRIKKCSNISMRRLVCTDSISVSLSLDQHSDNTLHDSHAPACFVVRLR